MSKFGIVGATALSLALAVATPAFAVGLRGGGTMHVGRGGSVVLKRASAPWYRALMPPIAPSAGRTTTGRPGSIWATMVSGVLAHGEWRPCP
jgi:hypothetical protein